MKYETITHCLYMWTKHQLENWTPKSRVWASNYTGGKVMAWMSNYATHIIMTTSIYPTMKHNFSSVNFICDESKRTEILRDFRWILSAHLTIKWIVMPLAWWRHQMETFSALLAICAGNSPAPGEFPTQRPVTRSFDVFFDLCLNKRLSKQWWGWWFETLSRPLWRHRNG